MSEGDVSLIHDEDVLRRMWQQTEDFGRKKEIRTHMYRLREERLRNLYSPEPTLDAKGCEFSSSPGHLRSFANQSFQSMKSKEVRDAGSPPKDFEYRGQDLKELSNAGWNVESENRTTDDGHTRIRSVQANIEGRYDVEGGKGQFAAIDQNKQSVTEYQDENTSLKRNESSSHAAAHEQVMRRTDDGSHFSSTTSSSTSTSKFQQSTSTKHETVPYITDNEHDISKRMNETDTNVEEMRRSKVTDYEQTHRKSNYDEAELVSKKVEYPDENTKVIVETRRLPDGTRVTSTRREFRGPVVNTSHSEHHSQNVRKENKSFTTSSQQRSDLRQTSRINDEFIDSQVHDIVDSQRVIDDIDFNKIYKTEQRDYTTDSKKTVDNQDIHKSHQFERHTYNTVNSKNIFDNNEVKKHVIDDNASDITYTTISDNDSVRHQNDNYSKIRNENYKETVKKTTNIHASKITDQHKITSITDNDKYIPNMPEDNEFSVNKMNEIKSYEVTKDTKDNNQNEMKTYKITKDTEDKRYNISPEVMKTEVNNPAENKAYKITKDTEDRRYNISPEDIETDVNNPNKPKTYKVPKDTEDKNVEEKTTSDLYQTTYQTDFNQRKISTEWSPTHQAWASTLRADTPPTTRPSTRASSPGSRTFKSSTSSLRSSVSPDKNIRKPGSRGTSPTKNVRNSPSRNTSDKISSTHSIQTVTKEVTNRFTSPDRKHPHRSSPTRHSVSPDRKFQDESRPKLSISPERHPHSRKTTPIDDHTVSTGRDKTPTRYSQSPEKLRHQPPTSKDVPTDFRPSSSPERKPPTGLTRKSPEKISHPAKTSTPTRPEIKPDKKREHDEFTKPVSSKSRKPANEIMKEHSPSRSFISDDIPGYMRPKSDRASDSPRISPTRQNNDRKSPNRNTSSQISDYTSESKTITTTKEDYYKLVDQNSHTVDEMKYTNKTTPKPHDNNIFKSTPIQTHTKDSPDSSKPSPVPSTLKTASRSPSPPKGPVTFTSTKEFDVKCSDEIDRTEKVDSKVTKISNTDDTKDSTIHFQSPNDNKNSGTPSKTKTPDRHSSPAKYGAYDKKQKHTEEINDSVRTVISDSRREKSPKKTSEAPENSYNFPRNRDSISPSKSSFKYSHTMDFIDNEIKTEEINKKTKDRPRQLITPSTSPTRKPAGNDKAPSTGQSSPTTSVSGFVYFSSPTTGKDNITHDQDIYLQTETSEYTRTDIKETPSKLPCKPPVPRQGSPSKDALPRKSSLKKPSDSMIPLPSPTEKPPTNFLVSPTEPDISIHNIVKKDRPEGPKSNSQIKQKPPLERRETYEERCRKILGMMDGSNDEITEITVTHGDVQKDSPSISPSRCPELKEDLTRTDYSSKTTIKDNVTDFITHEQDEIRKTTKQKQSMKPTSSRDNSPTKLKDILVLQKEYIDNSTIKKENKETYEVIVKSQNDHQELKRSSKSPESKFKQPSPTREIFDQQKQSRTPSPTKKIGYVKEKPKSYETMLTKNVTEDDEFISKNTSTQPDIIHKDTVSKKPDKTICYSYPETSTVTKETKKSSEESRQTYYDISEKSSDTIHETKTLKKFNEPRSRTPSPTKTTAKVTEYDRINENKKNKMPVLQPKQEKYIEPIKSRTPSPTKTLTKVSDNKEKTESVTKKAPKYLSEKSNDRVVEDKHKEHVHSRTPSPKNKSKVSDYYMEQEIQCTSRRELKQSDVPEKIKPVSQKSNLHARTPSPTKTSIKTKEEIRPDFNEQNTRKSSQYPSEAPQYNYTKKKLSEPIHTRTPSPNKSMPKATDEENYSIRQVQMKTKVVEKGNPQNKLYEPHQSRTPSTDKSFTITKHINETIDYSTSSIHQDMSDTIKTNTSPMIFKQKSRSRTPSPIKPTTKEIENKTCKQTSDVPSDKYSISQKFEVPKANRVTSPTKKQQETPFSVNSPTDSPNTIKNKLTEKSDEFIITERDQEILDKRTLKNLSPERYRKSPARDDVFDIECSASIETSASDGLQKISHKENIKEENIVKLFEEKSRETYIPSKLPSRNVSPTKKAPAGHPRPEKTPESPTKSRSISPRKPVSPIARPQSPQTPKTSISKPKEPLHGVNKATTMTKVEKLSTTSETKKTINTIKQNSFTKTTNKPSETTKNNTTKKDSSIKITRTTSDIHKKPSPQKMRSKPEIQVTEITSKLTKQTPTKLKKPTVKEPQSKLIGKPKSATALNTSTDDEDVLVDVQQAKSSRENSPDRICPTPVNIMDDVGTPRFPDEVNEPDDDYRRRTHHTIHETETIVDDIVEISEEDELFVKKSQHVNELNDCLVGVHDGVKPKNTTMQFIETENRTHSDFIDENLKSDECLLSVSEKVNKFAKGPKATKECKSPSRRVVDEYDTDTVYQDNYTKLSVNDKANLFIQTAEKNKSPVTKPTQKAERPDLNDIDDSLKSDDCLLSVSDKVNKFVKTAEQFFTETIETEEKDKKIKEKHDIIMKSIVQKCDNDYYESDDTTETENQEHLHEKTVHQRGDKLKVVKKETVSKKNEYSSPNSKPTDRTSTVKITTLRSSEAVKKAKALFENIASTTQKTKNQTTKLTDIGVTKKTPRTISTIVHHPSVEGSATDGDSEVDIPQSPVQAVYSTPTFIKQQYPDNNKPENKVRNSPTRSCSQNSEVPRSGTPSRHTVESTNTTKTMLSRYPAPSKSETQKYSNADADKPDKPHDYVPGYLRPTKTSQIREETKITEESHVSSRRGSGKFGIELRRTSTDRTSVSSEGRHSVDHPQPCIEDIFDVDLLEQMLEKVTGYEQRRHIRAQIRVAKKQTEGNFVDTNTYTKTIKHTPLKNKSPERQAKPSPQRTLSPDHLSKTKPSKPMSPDRRQSKEASKPITNGNAREPTKTISEKPQRLRSPEKNVTKSISKTKSPVRHPSPEKKPSSINVSTPKSKSTRFNEYATAYMKKVGINESDKTKFTGKTKKIVEVAGDETPQHFNELNTMRTESTSTVKTLTEKISSKDMIEEVNENGKRTSSPEKKRSPERQPESPTERLHQRTPSPDFKRPKSDSSKKEITVKTVYNIDKKLQPKQVQEEKPSWVTNRNLKKITSESRTFSTKKIENEKPKYRAPSPSKVISKPTDVITSSYGPGPLDADGRPLFGIKALRHGATNYQVKGTVIRQEYHSKNGGEPEGTVSVTAYSTEPEDLEKLMSIQGERPSRLHGLAAITTTKKFGGTTGTTIKEAHSKEERVSLEQFTHSDRKVTDVDSQVVDVTEHRPTETPRHLDAEMSTKTNDRRQKGVTHRVEDVTQKMDERKQKKGQTVRQSSVKSLTEKFIKNATDSSRTERVSYPKAGLILRTTTTRESVSSDNSNHAGLARTDSERSLVSDDDETVVTTVQENDGRRVTTTTSTRHHHHHHHDHGHGHGQESFLDSNTKVTGVQDILTRMKNADIVITEGDSSEDAEARALLNKFLGASVLMAGMQAHVERAAPSHLTLTKETVHSSGGRVSSDRSVQEIDLDQCWDERLLKTLLDECTDYEQRRLLRARIRTLMAEQEACATAVTDAVSGAEETNEPADETREEEVTVTSSVRRNSSEKTVSSSTTTKTSKVIESVSRPAPAAKPVSPFAKFRQLEKQNSTNSPNSPGSPGSPQSPGSPAPFFKFTDPALQASAVTIKERLLQWCRDKTRDYENVKLENFSTSWADGLAFCALVHHFLPNAFDYSKLTADKRRHNFTLAFKVADEKAGIYPLLDVDDMVAMRKPDWKCVFTYVQSIHRRFKDQN